MTDKELIQALRCCVSSPKRDGCRSTCVFFNGDINWCIPEMGKAVSDRLEALLAENERLKAQVPKWVSVEERLPEMHAETYDDIDGPHKFWRSGTVLGVNRAGDVETVRYSQEEGGETCWEDEPGNYYEITHWIPLPEPPSTEGGGVNGEV